MTYRNPFTHPWDGDTGNVAAYVRAAQGNDFTVFAINCAHLAVPFAGSISHNYLCVPATAVFITQTAIAQLGRRNAVCSNIRSALPTGKLMIDAGQLPTLAGQQAKLVKGITPCPGTKTPTIG